jgi:hypothetical protein
MAVRKNIFSEGGVSESIGFILIFSMVIAGIGLVTLYGYPLLLSQQTNANERIMEKNMIVLQNDVKSIAYKTVPYKESSLKIEGGALTVYKPTTPPVSKIDIGDCGGSSDEYVKAFQAGELRYYSASADSDISLQNGAVVMRKHTQPGSAMLAEPRWFYDAQTNTLVVNLIGFNSTDNIARSGIGTVHMTMGEINYTYVSRITGDLCVVYTPDPDMDYSVAWDSYFMKALNNAPNVVVSRSGTPDTGLPLTYRLSQGGANPMTLVVKRYEVIIKSL